MFFLLLVTGGVLFVVFKQYNRLQVMAQGVHESHSNVMASMKKRVDLTNKLIDIAKGYADHEKLTHISVANAGEGTAVSGVGLAASGALTQVLKLATQYPDLKANTAYQMLMSQLEVIEVDLQTKRESYNGQVRLYNSSIGQLPVSLYARQLGFRSAPYFEVDNADSLEKLRDFHNEDAEHLKAMFAQGSRKLAEGSRMLAEESMRIGKIAVEKGMEKSAELQKRHAATAGDGSMTNGSTIPEIPVAPPKAASEENTNLQ
jgi:LemA protein